MSLWSWSTPIAVFAVMLLAAHLPLHSLLVGLVALALVAGVVTAVHHAETVARRLGEPLGAVLLSISMTAIEAPLIVIMMIAEPARSSLARDTIFSVLMITCNGLVGLSLVIGAIRYRTQSFQVVGANAILMTLIALTTLTMVLPSFTISSPGPTYTSAQLGFASIASLLLWGISVFVQTVQHRDCFLPIGAGEEAEVVSRPTARMSLLGLALLIVSLVAVVGLAHELSPLLALAVDKLGAPAAVLSIAIALLTLLPEGAAALRAALHDRLQISFNLAMGSALASIGLTIPVVALVSILMHVPLDLGLQPKELVLSMVTFLIASITFVSGRTHMLQGVVHLALFAAFLFFSWVP